MHTTASATTLTHVREELYRCCGMRRDARFEVLDALTTAAGVESLVGLSLTPGFQRGWAAVCDALSDGSLDVPALQRVLVAALDADPTPVGGRVLWALDGSSWGRPTAPTSPERTTCRVLVPGSAHATLVDGWEYQWLVAVSEDGSWVRPLAIARRAPTAGTPTVLAIAQVRAVQAARQAAGLPPDAPDARPILLLDSSYAVGQLVAADLGVDVLARLASTRTFRRPAPPWRGIGRVPKHGPPLRLVDPTTHGEPDHRAVLPDPVHGTVTIDRWDRLHEKRQANVEFSVIRIQYARYSPRAHRDGAPPPLWLIWTGTALPPVADLFRRWYRCRFAIEHAFRFLKQDLGWTTPRLRWPEAADRWSWLVALALWQLWLARELVVPVRRPWDPQRAPATRPPLTPGQVRRVCAGLFATLATPARSPRRRGNAPGRQPGQAPGRARRFPAVKHGAPPPTTGSRAPP